MKESTKWLILDGFLFVFSVTIVGCIIYAGASFLNELKNHIIIIKF